MARLQNWAENSIRVVDEKGDGTARIRLVSQDGSCWQTWDAPFPKPEDWVADAEALCAELAEDFSGEVHCMFIAESASGTVRSQCPRKIAGKQRKGANGTTFGQQGAPLQAMYEAQARTVERTLQSANVQLEVLTRTVESQAKANSELLDFIRVRNEHDALDRAEQSSDVQQMLGQLLEQAPLLLELAMAKKKGKTAAAGGGLAQKVQAAVSETVKTAAVDAATNGAQQVAAAVIPAPKGN